MLIVADRIYTNAQMPTGQMRGQPAPIPLLNVSGSPSETLSVFYGPGVIQTRQNVSLQAPEILSASTYPGAPSTAAPGKHNPKRKPSQTTFGGYFIDDGEISHRHVDSNPSPKKKRRRSPKSDEEDGKKQRGRPRLDTHDETAADRRRTQIRLAQRAYRHRKETTISALKGRVNELERTI